MQIDTPLLISAPIQIDEHNFNIAGDNWSFNTASPWRLVKENKIVAAFDYNIETVAKLLNQTSLVKIEKSPISPDISLHFDNDVILQIFTTDPLDAWIFDSPTTVWTA